MAGLDSSTWKVVMQRLAAVPERRQDVLAAINGAVGDQLVERGSGYATPMSLLHRGLELAVANGEVEQLGQAKSRLVIWVHGLMASDRFWDQVAQPGLPTRCEGDLDVDSICVRYNSGRHISTNGRQLATQLEELIAAWPVDVEEINIVGHSMGGLLARSAIHYGSEMNASWVDKLKRVFLLGVPQRGAPLEQLVHLASFTLRHIPNPWTWGISWVMQQRSAGIRDLRHGYLIDEEWGHRHPEALSLGKRHLIPLPKHVRHYVMAGTLAEGEAHPLSRALGDAMVAPASAKDESIWGQSGADTPNASRVFSGVGHVGLAGDDQVYAQMLEWWDGDPPA